MMQKIAMLTCAAIFLCLITGLSAQEMTSNARPDILDGIGIDQKLNEQVPLDLKFRNEAGQEVTLQDYFGDKPVVLSLVYYECPMLCTMILNGLVRAVKVLDFNIGDEYEIVTVSFDAKETPQMAAAKKKSYIAEYAREGAEDGWHFLTGDQEAISRLTKSVGFNYTYDAERDEYVHASGIMILTPDGKISRYAYGIEYAPRDLKLGIMAASEEKIGSPVDQVLLYCYHYDPTTGKYGVAIMRIIRIVGLLTVLAIVGFIGLSIYREKRSRVRLRGLNERIN